MASKFSFPVLNRKEIVAILSETGIIAIREQDLINPIPDNIVSIYNAILIYLDPLQDDNDQANFHALERLDNPDLHNDCVRNLNLLRNIKEVVNAVGCNLNFTLKDLAKPDTDRTGIFLSAILNFCLYRESKLNLIQPSVNEANLHEEKLRELDARIRQLNEEKMELEAAREMEQPLVQETDAKVKELRQTIHDLNNYQSTLKSEFLKLREKSNELIAEITNADFALTQSEQENRKLQSMIVQSPEKLKGALEEKKLAWDEIKRTERSALQSLQEKNATLEVYSKAQEKMAKHLSQMQAIQEQVNSSKTIEKDVKVLKSKLTEEIVLDKSLEAKIVERQGQAEQMKELLKAFEKEKDVKIEELTKELDRVKLEVDSERRKMVSRKKNVEATCIEVDKINSEINSVRESGLRKQQELLRSSEELVKEFFNYSSEIEDSMRNGEALLLGKS